MSESRRAARANEAAGHVLAASGRLGASLAEDGGRLAPHEAEVAPARAISAASRGRIAVLDRAAIEAAFRDGHAAMRKHVERMLPGVHPIFRGAGA